MAYERTEKNRKTKSLQFTNNVTNVTKIKLIKHQFEVDFRKVENCI